VAQKTEELEAVQLDQRESPRAPARWWRGLTGTLAAGLVVLALAVLGTGVFAIFSSIAGPGPMFLVVHPVAAIVAVLAQRVADRRQGVLAAAAGIAVVAIVAVVLWLCWWA
jgi:predicted lipid-binding transport protein (Tim44 family)